MWPLRLFEANQMISLCSYVRAKGRFSAKNTDSKFSEQIGDFSFGLHEKIF